MDVAFFSKTDYSPQKLKKILKRAAALALKEKHLNSRDPYEISIIFVDENEIRKINNEFRRIDRTTDVVSFAFADGKGAEYAPFLLGDIFVCPDVVARHAKRYGTTFDAEMVFATLHGILHLLGFDHQKKAERDKMRAAEDLLMGRLIADWSGRGED